MLDLEDAFDGLKTTVKGTLAIVRAAFARGGVAAKAWPYWTPAIILAAVAGHCL
jgi:hypothetical protein